MDFISDVVCKTGLFRVRLGFFSAIAVVLSIGTPLAGAQVVWHVDDDAALGGDGATWASAYRYLQDVLSLAADGDEIRVAQGVYMPDEDEFGLVTPDDREASFGLVSGVRMYGGYAGLGASEPDERDVGLYETILSGDLYGDDGPDFANYDVDNSYHVVCGEYLSSGGVLDGFVISGGCATLEGVAHGTSGGGAFLTGGEPRIVQCVFRNNYAVMCGALYNDGRAVIVDTTFVSNRALELAGGLGATMASTTLVGCTFYDNEALGLATSQGGGGVYAGVAPLELINCTFVGNSAGLNGGAILSLVSPVTATNCLFNGNMAAAGGAVYTYYEDFEATNCIFHANAANQHCGGVWIDRTDGVLTNCVFWNNTDIDGAGESAQLAHTRAGEIHLSYSCIQNYAGSFGDEGVITDDPLFVDGDGADDVAGTLDDDLRLAPGSPCIDAGDNDAIPWDWNDLDDDGEIIEPLPFDLDLNPRFVDDPDTPDTGAGSPPVVDMGPYELLRAGLVVSVSNLPVPEGATATFSVLLATQPTDPVSVSVAVVAGDSDITIESGAMLEFDADNFGTPQAVVVAAADDEDLVDGEATIEIAATGFLSVQVVASEVDDDVPAGVIRVKADAAPGGDGTTWESAFRDLQDGLEAAAAYGGPVEVWVAAGTYTPDWGTGNREASFVLLDDVALLGGFAGDEDVVEQRDPVANLTVLSGDIGDDDDSYHVVSTEDTDETAVLDGFTIREGHSLFGDDGGGGLLITSASPTIRDCVFTDNSALFGGAVSVVFNAYPTFIGCTFARNEAVGSHADRLGGAVYLIYSDATFVRCTFVGNQAFAGGGAVAGLDADVSVTNCRFFGNTCDDIGAALYLRLGQCRIVNCVFSGNDGAAALEFSTGQLLLANSDFSGNSGGGVTLVSDCDVTVDNCVSWGNEIGGVADENAQIRVLWHNVELRVNYCCVQGWTGDLGGIGNHGLDPLFTDADGPDDTLGTEDDDLRLSAGSPCIDSGSNWFVPADFADLDGDGDFDEPTPFDLDDHDRFIDDPETPDGGGGTIAIVDMGAYEFGVMGIQYCFGDLDGDRQITVADLTVLLSNYGTPTGASPVQGDIDTDGDVDLADLAWMLSRYGESCD